MIDSRPQHLLVGMLLVLGLAPAAAPGRWTYTSGSRTRVRIVSERCPSTTLSTRESVTEKIRYPLPVAPLISRFADSAVLLKRRPKTLPQLPRGSVYIIYESIQRLEA